MRKQEKKEFVKDLTQELETASSVILVDYTGLSVKMQQDLKKRLHEIGANLSVVKNTLFKIAGKNAKVPEEAIEDSVLSGPTAIVLTEGDPVAPLKILANFSKQNEIPQFKVGIVEKSFCCKEDLISLSELPNKDALVAQAVGAIAQPMSGIVFVLQAKLQGLVSILKQASKK